MCIMQFELVHIIKTMTIIPNSNSKRGNNKKKNPDQTKGYQQTECKNNHLIPYSEQEF